MREDERNSIHTVQIRARMFMLKSCLGSVLRGLNNGTWESVSLRSLNSALNIPNSSYKQSLHVSIYIVIKVQSQLMLITPSSLLLPVSLLKLLVHPIVYKSLASIGL